MGLPRWSERSRGVVGVVANVVGEIAGVVGVVADVVGEIAKVPDAGEVSSSA